MRGLGDLPAFADDGVVHVVIESPRGSTSKFAFDAKRGVMILSRPLPNGLAYPHDWGFIPSTHAADGDPLDAMVMWDGSSYPGVVIASRPIGVLRVEQTNLQSKARERNDRVVAVPIKAARLASTASILDEPDRVRLELQHFFLAATALEGKEVSIIGWGGPADALALVRASLKG
jgi:inorganic pyrophosphatase